MNKSRLFVGLLLVAFLVMCTPASHAQTATNCQSAGSTINCNVIAVGSSAIFPSAAIAAVTGDPQRAVTAPLCGSNFWTGSANGRDARQGITGTNIPDEPGSVWVAWDSSTTPTIICVYFSVDSLVGQRLFYGQGSGASGPNNNGTLILNAAACQTQGAKKVAFMWEPTPNFLPVTVYNALMGTTGTACPAAAPALPVHFTTASTDVSPADALFVGNQRVLGPNTLTTASFPTDTKTNLGYGSASGTCISSNPAIASSYETSTIANAICYTYLSGQPDPISGTAIPASQISDEGALAMLPLIGITHNASGSGGFGDLFANKGFNDVLSSSIAAGYAFSSYGTATLTRDLFIGNGSASGIPVVVSHYLAREPMSGTYTTWEWQVVRNKESALGGGALSQETNVCGPTQGGPPPTGCGYSTPANNPAACPGQASFLTNKVFPATSTCSNYMSWGTPSFNALKTRVLGTGEMVKVLNVDSTAGIAGTTCPAGTFPAFPCITDTFGYAFWSLGTFGGVSHVKYLQLDSQDALYPGWSTTNGGNGGAFPTTDPNQGTNATGLSAVGAGCQGYFNGDGVAVQVFTCNASWPFPTFGNIVSGNYRSWSTNRVVWYCPGGASGCPLNPVFTTTGLNAPGFWLSAADQAAPVIGSPAHGKIPDFLPFGYCANAAACPSGSAPTLTYPMNAFRAHYAVSGWGIGNANNGVSGTGYTTASVAAENGGDVAGTIIGLQAEADSVNFFSGSFLSWVQ